MAASILEERGDILSMSPACARVVRQKRRRWRLALLRRPNTPDTLDVDAKKYLENADSNDGRRTEAQLQNWFRTVTPADDLYEQLHSGLVAFLARYGKTPSAKARINILKFPRRGNAPAENEESNADTIVAMTSQLRRYLGA